jgi:hypothetical protein
VTELTMSDIIIRVEEKARPQITQIDRIILRVIREIRGQMKK